MLEFALEVAAASDGAYDPAAGAIVNRWGFGPRQRYDQPGFVAPGPAEQALLRAPRAPLDWQPASRRLRQPGAVALDLSAVAKGYGVDRLALYLQGLGLRHFLVEVGGELRGAGLKADGQPWWVMLEQPAAGADAPELVLALHGLAVATSGDYRRYFEADAQRVPHTIDPRTAAPIDNGLASVSVVHPSCMAADAWSTALTVLGPQAGLALAERQGLAARFLVRNGATFTQILSAPLRAMLDDTDD